jgi:hypothetical protein
VRELASHPQCAFVSGALQIHCCRRVAHLTIGAGERRGRPSRRAVARWTHPGACRDVQTFSFRGGGWVRRVLRGRRGLRPLLPRCEALSHPLPRRGGCGGASARRQHDPRLPAHAQVQPQRPDLPAEIRQGRAPSRRGLQSGDQVLARLLCVPYSRPDAKAASRSGSGCRR